MTVELLFDGMPFAENISDGEKLCFAEPWSLQAVKDFLSYDYNGTVVAIADGIFAGYITYTCICGEVQIANVATMPEFRRNGIARMMLSKLIEKTKEQGGEVITLEVRSQNSGAIALYKNCGFEEMGVRKGFYKNPCDDALLMNYMVDKP